MSHGLSIQLDALEVQVEANGEDVLPWSSEPVSKYRVKVIAEDGYVFEAPVWRRPPYNERGERESVTRGHNAPAWMMLDLLLGAARDPLWKAHTTAANEALYSQWLAWAQENQAYVSALDAAGKRLAPLLERNAATIIEGGEESEW